MKGRKNSWFLAIIFILITVLISGCVAGPQQTDIPKGEMNQVFNNQIPYEPVNVVLKIPDQTLPYPYETLVNLKEVQSALSISSEAIVKVSENGFTVIKNPFYLHEQDIIAPYKTLKNSGVPIFVTSDSLLHLYHIQFDKTLRDLEERELYDQIWLLSSGLLSGSLSDYENNQGEVREAARRNIAFLSIGLEMLKPDSDQIAMGDTVSDPLSFEGDDAALGLFTQEDAKQYVYDIPAIVLDDVNAEISRIRSHNGYSDSPVFHYPEDYSQYVPRGHYTQSEKLKNYFTAMMWYGRMSFLLKGGDDGLVTNADARIQTYGASLISEILNKDPTLMNRWDRIYNVTSFFVGTSDDLGPYEYLAAIDAVFNDSFHPDQLNEQQYSDMKIKLAEFPSPRIYGGTGDCAIDPPFTKEDADSCLEATKGFRLMGQRFIPDSYFFSQLTGPYTGFFTGTGSPFTRVGTIRGFPLGLDVMALLGSSRATDLISGSKNAAYERYQEQCNMLSGEINSFSQAEWQKNLYWSWLYSLIPLLEKPQAGYPAFMQNDAWLDKSISTALASWTELRHDTILYAKQSYTMRCTAVAPSIEEPKPVVGYVEPNPELYNRLYYLTKMTRTGLASLDVLDDAAQERLIHLEEILLHLVDISTRELANSTLSSEDYDFINAFGDTIESVVGDVDEKTKWTTIVADVHTDGNSLQVLEEGVGYVDLIVVAYPVPDGRTIVGAGPVMSYYEFKQPMADRLTDEAWREMLADTQVKSPWWTASFTA